jgi:hypothetical protein
MNGSTACHSHLLLDHLLHRHMLDHHLKLEIAGWAAGCRKDLEKNNEMD